MKHLLTSLSCLGLMAGMASAADIHGVLMDKMCSAKAVKGGQSVATAHDREMRTDAALPTERVWGLH